MLQNRLKKARVVDGSCGLSLDEVAFGFGSDYFEEE